MWFNDELTDVKWHRSVNAFSLMNTNEKEESPFMSSTQAHEALISCFKTRQDPSEKPGLDRKSYQVNFDDNSGLAHALRLIQKSTPDALHNLYIENNADFWKSFSNPAFKPTSLVNFSSGWTLTGKNYLEWAKHGKLEPGQFSREVRLNFNPSVPPKYLEAESRTRTQLVNSISGLSMLDSLAKELKGNAASHTAVEAISRHHLSVLSDYSLRWFVAKTDIRKIMLQGSQAPQAIDLLESNVWEPTIFAKDAVKSLIDSDVPRIGIEKRLKIFAETSHKYRQYPNRVNPAKLGRKISKQTSNNQFFLREHSPVRYDNSNNYTPQHNYRNKQSQNKSNPKGAQYQKAGNSHQKQRRNNKNNSWNKQKNAKGPSGFTGAPKGNKNTQQ